MEQRGKFGTKIGVILATAGSAVGLGNIWRFPYMTGQDGGAAFILIYLVCMLFLGVPGMIAEFVVGRHSASNAVRAYKNLGNGKPWHIIGVIGVFYRNCYSGFLCSGGRLVLAISLFFVDGSSEWRCRICEDIFR